MKKINNVFEIVVVLVFFVVMASFITDKPIFTGMVTGTNDLFYECKVIDIDARIDGNSVVLTWDEEKWDYSDICPGFRSFDVVNLNDITTPNIAIGTITDRSVRTFTDNNPQSQNFYQIMTRYDAATDYTYGNKVMVDMGTGETLYLDNYCSGLNCESYCDSTGAYHFGYCVANYCKYNVYDGSDKCVNTVQDTCADEDLSDRCVDGTTWTYNYNCANGVVTYSEDINSVDHCGYVVPDPCTGKDLSDRCVDGTTWTYNYNCANGVVNYSEDINSVDHCGYDACLDADYCEDYCNNVTHVKHYAIGCEDNKCVYQRQSNSTECGYVPPTIDVPNSDVQNVSDNTPVPDDLIKDTTLTNDSKTKIIQPSLSEHLNESQIVDHINRTGETPSGVEVQPVFDNSIPGPVPKKPRATIQELKQKETRHLEQQPIVERVDIRLIQEDKIRETPHKEEIVKNTRKEAIKLIEDVSNSIVENKKQSLPELQDPVKEKIEISNVRKEITIKARSAEKQLEVRKKVRKAKEVIESAEEGVTMITISVKPKEKIVYNVSIYEHIPKDVASSALELIFYGEGNVEIVRDDPLIVWHIAALTEETELHYSVKKNVEQVLDRTKTLALSPPKDTSKRTLVISILLLVGIVVIVIFIKVLEGKIQQENDD
ncbi:MAG: hypothetical protein U9O94_05565 [Nanoarchaeota archaeon]|nr:hypothetical protein [Nanoarchaeota archaeon]